MKNFLSILFLLFALNIGAQHLSKDDLPFIGAQVFIEPGQTKNDIEGWFAQMQKCGMTVCRIRMFQQYMERPDGTCDFSLFDTAFDAAKRHHIKVYCTLFPTTLKTDIGGWKFPKDNVQQADFANFIKALVSHYRSNEALKGWVIINEPGTDGKNLSSKYINDAWKLWQEKHPDNMLAENGYPILTSPCRQAFIYDFTAQYLNWIASEVRKYDRNHDIHVNPANVFGNIGEYDWTSWRTFLTSLGGSAHPSWHYTSFNRPQFTLAMAIESEIIKNGAATLPWFMTEIQGGNNIWSGSKPFCPTSHEIAQWLWTVIGTGGKGAIFWMLNPRSSGIESGEWALLDYQGQATSRMKAAASVASCIYQNSNFFAKARQEEAGVDIVYTKESFWAERVVGKSGETQAGSTGPQVGSVFKSIASAYRSLSECGIQANITQFDNYNFTEQSYNGRTIILANQICLPHYALPKLQRFVENGGTLIVEGLTGYFDENLHNTNTIPNNSQWKELIGGEIGQYICHENTFYLDIDEYRLPALWQQGIIAHSSKQYQIHKNGKGKVFFIPSCISLGAWETDNYKPLSDFICNQLPQSKAIQFDSYHKDVLLRVMYNGSQIVTIIINNSSSTQNVGLMNLPAKVSPKMLYAQSKSTPMTLCPGEVQVIRWK